MPVTAILALLKAGVAPLSKLALNMLLPLLTDKLVKQAAYRLLKSKAEQYRSRAYASKEVEDDKKAEMFMGMVKDLKAAWGIEE